MSKFKLKDISSNNNLTEIKVYDLQYVDIDTHDIDTIIDLIKKLRKKFIMEFMWFFLFFILSLFILYNEVESSNSVFTLNILGGSFIPLMFLFLIFYLFKQIASLKLESLKKAQYGVVKNKYHFTNTTENGTTRDCRVNVKFINSSTYIRKVCCTNEIYEKLSIGDKVLVISFDNKKAYVISCKNKQLN